MTSEMQKTIQAWTFEAKDEGEIAIKVCNATNYNLHFWIGDKWQNKNTILADRSVFYWNFTSHNRNTIVFIKLRTHHWAAAYNQQLQTYVKFPIYDQGAPRGNNLFVIYDTEVHINGEKLNNFRQIDSEGQEMLKEYNWK